MVGIGRMTDISTMPTTITIIAATTAIIFAATVSTAADPSSVNSMATTATAPIATTKDKIGAN
jgi:hypothetical protein